MRVICHFTNNYEVPFWPNHFCLVGVWDLSITWIPYVGFPMCSQHVTAKASRSIVIHSSFGKLFTLHLGLPFVFPKSFSTWEIFKRRFNYCMTWVSRFSVWRTICSPSWCKSSLLPAEGFCRFSVISSSPQVWPTGPRLPSQPVFGMMLDGVNVRIW